MSRQFQPGDRVIRTYSNHLMSVGTVCTVEAVDTVDGHIRLEGLSGLWYPDRFRLYKTPIKIGTEFRYRSKDSTTWYEVVVDGHCLYDAATNDCLGLADDNINCPCREGDYNLRTVYEELLRVHQEHGYIFEVIEDEQ